MILSRVRCTCEDGSTFFEEGYTTEEFLTFGHVVNATEEMEDSPHQTAHGETSAQVVDDAVWTWFLSEHLVEDIGYIKLLIQVIIILHKIVLLIYLLIIDKNILFIIFIYIY
jgi:hypothetical protein